MPVDRSIKISGRQLRIFLANRAIALGWVLRGSCEACAHRLLACAWWLAPEARRFLVHRTGYSHNQYQRGLKFAPDLTSLLHRIQPFRVAAGLLIVLLLGSLDLATRATVSERAQRPIAEPLSSGTQRETVPLPTRKPQVAAKILKKKAANAVTQKRMAQRKRTKR
jgi:hypothetical protein